MLKHLPILLLSTSVFAMAASANEIEEAATELCEKVKACSMAHIAEADLTPEVRQMMEPMLQNMCETMRAGVREVPLDHSLYQPSVDCMRSMAVLSCEAMMDSEQIVTPQCKDYEERVKSAAGE
jgi:hypothetical protein